MMPREFSARMAEQPRRRRRGRWIAGAVSTIVVLFFTLLVVGARDSRERHRQELLEVWGDLSLGMSAEQVRAVWKTKGSTGLFDERGDGRWMLNTPVEFGAGNWVLWIEFKEKRVTGLRIRVLDSEHVHPEDAPADKVAPE